MNGEPSDTLHEIKRKTPPRKEDPPSTLERERERERERRDEVRVVSPPGMVRERERGSERGRERERGEWAEG